MQVADAEILPRPQGVKQSPAHCDCSSGVIALPKTTSNDESLAGMIFMRSPAPIVCAVPPDE